ncbi:hypothetical protein HO133_000700 [Letharia lupina]|uniref:Uncharacterized protein n=1 Tax=Letharia lupina TaxID=560253 RepID=A0A8H6CFX1_9LECA|nr:uncharacterized protein HO133_000700 [Letharia lupina]KAF6222653.1 hypothetical protein HO133_000700 [Letharia lupina]
MYTILSTLLTIHTILALSAGALATAALNERRSGGSGTLGHDADLTISVWDDIDCTPTFEPNSEFHLSWGVMQPTNGSTNTFKLSRVLRDNEQLDWSAATADPPGANRARSERIVPGCEHFLRTMHTAPGGIESLQENTCYQLDLGANCVNLVDRSDPPQFS